MLLPHDLAITQFVNADTIAAGLAGFAPETAALQAGRIMLVRIRELAAQRQDFAFETTLASRSFAPFLRQIQADGYQVSLLYIWLRSPELAQHRVQERVRRGGHSVPPEVITRRYWRRVANFLHIYRPLADSWVLCDNSSESVKVVALGAGAKVSELLDRELYDGITRSAEHGG